MQSAENQPYVSVGTCHIRLQPRSISQASRAPQTVGRLPPRLCCSCTGSRPVHRINNPDLGPQSLNRTVRESAKWHRAALRSVAQQNCIWMGFEVRTPRQISARRCNRASNLAITEATDPVRGAGVHTIQGRLGPAEGPIDIVCAGMRMKT
jgi:hypothetical protein